MNWVSVGQGAIGLLTACRLHTAGYPVTLLLRQPQTLTVCFKTAASAQTCQFNAAKAPFNAVFVAVKAYALKACLAQLQPALTPDAQLVISHNGMPDLDYLKQYVSEQQGIWFLSTSHAALRTANAVEHTGQGQSIISPLNNAALQAQPVVMAAMQQALPPVTLTEDIKPALWRKLAVNAAINPLSALLNCRNGELATAALTPRITQLVNEVCQVAALENIALDPKQTLELVYKVITDTAQNYSSMQQDKRFNRQLELDAITGFILKTATKHRLAVPENQALWQALQ